MTTYLVRQLRFARSEFLRGLDGVSNEEGQQRIGQMNSIGWIVGHLAHHENFLWVVSAQEKVLYPELHEVVGYGKPASIPSLDEMWDVWQKVTESADEYLDTLTDEMMVEFLSYAGKQLRENIGTTLMRNTYHIWFHLGEAHAIRQQVGHQPPDFVGGFSQAAFKQGDLRN
jgi:uncharacterized damage-inducible protein DinB